MFISTSKTLRKEKFIVNGLYLAGSVGRACDSGSWACKFEADVGYRNYLKINLKNRKIYS